MSTKRWNVDITSGGYFSAESEESASKVEAGNFGDDITVSVTMFGRENTAILPVEDAELFALYITKMCRRIKLQKQKQR